jgi:hypothetical protein
MHATIAVKALANPWFSLIVPIAPLLLVVLGTLNGDCEVPMTEGV